MKSLFLRFGFLQAFMMAINGILAPILYLLLAGKGYSLAEVGVLIAITTAATMLCEVPFGMLADRYGRKMVFLLGQTVLVVATIGLWQSKSLASLSFFMALSGVSAALISGTLDALFVQQFQALPPDQSPLGLQHAQAYIGIFQLLGLALGAVVGGWLPEWFHSWTDATPSVALYDINCIVMVPLLLIHIFATSLLIRDSRSVEGGGGQTSSLKVFVSNAVEELKTSRTLQVFMLAQLIGGGVAMSIETLWQPRAAQLSDGAHGTWIFGLMLMMSSIVGAVGQSLSLPLGKLVKNRYDKLLLAAELMLAGTFALLAVQQSVSGFLVAYALFFLVAGISMVPFMTVFHSVVSEAHRSTMLSLKSLVTMLGGTIGAVVFGNIAGGEGISTAWIWAGGVLLVSVPIYLVPAVREFCQNLATALNQGAEVKVEESQAETA
ncbi:MFS transporter [Roseateles sp. DB2]|uniref:MFS transporter n=1 Tax=Roseateles sp. DB2 TaxID=3453717 RepID=UPI003EEBD2D0